MILESRNRSRPNVPSYKMICKKEVVDLVVFCFLVLELFSVFKFLCCLLYEGGDQFQFLSVSKLRQIETSPSTELFYLHLSILLISICVLSLSSFKYR